MLLTNRPVGLSVFSFFTYGISYIVYRISYIVLYNEDYRMYLTLTQCRKPWPPPHNQAISLAACELRAMLSCVHGPLPQPPGPKYIPYCVPYCTYVYPVASLFPFVRLRSKPRGVLPPSVLQSNLPRLRSTSWQPFISLRGGGEA